MAILFLTLVQKPSTEVVRIITSGCLLDLWPGASKLTRLLVPGVVHLKGGVEAVTT